MNNRITFKFLGQLDSLSEYFNYKLTYYIMQTITKQAWNFYTHTIKLDLHQFPTRSMQM